MKTREVEVLLLYVTFYSDVKKSPYVTFSPSSSSNINFPFWKTGLYKQSSVSVLYYSSTKHLITSRWHLVSASWQRCMRSWKPCMRSWQRYMRSWQRRMSSWQRCMHNFMFCWRWILLQFGYLQRLYAQSWSDSCVSFLALNITQMGKCLSHKQFYSYGSK